MWFFYLILGLLLFFLQNLLPLPPPLHLDLLTLLMIFLSLRASPILAVAMAFFFGVMLDCYGLAPLGLQVGRLFLAVLGVKVLRRHLNFHYIVPQIVGVGLIMVAQGLFMALSLHLLLPTPVNYQPLLRQGLFQLTVTALSAPLVLALLGLLEKHWSRFFAIKSSLAD